MTARTLGRSLTLPWGAVVLFSVLGFLDAVFNYFWTGNGIHGSEGALLVVVSTLLMALAAGAIGAGWVKGWLKVLLEVLIVLDFLGTGTAAYFLEAWILLVLIVLAAIAWVAHLILPRASLATSG